MTDRTWNILGVLCGIAFVGCLVGLIIVGT